MLFDNDEINNASLIKGWPCGDKDTNTHKKSNFYSQEPIVAIQHEDWNYRCMGQWWGMDHQTTIMVDSTKYKYQRWAASPSVPECTSRPPIYSKGIPQE